MLKVLQIAQAEVGTRESGDNGQVYVSLIDNNVWSPDDYPQGWQKT